MIAVRALAALLSLAAQDAPGEPGTPPADIVVTGERSALGERIDRFVTAVTAETGNGQVARWDRRLCLDVEGVTQAQRAFLGNTIAAEGRALGLDVEAGRRCEPSAFIIFSADPDALLARLGKRRPYFFGGIPPEMRQGLRGPAAPVRWLSFAQLRGAGGERPAGFTVDLGKGGTERTLPSIRSVPSRLETAARMDVQAMVVLVDARRLAGVSYGSLAAYLAMVVLGNVRPESGSDRQVDGSVSILGLFRDARRGEVATGGLTEWDRAYLRALYQGNWNVAAGQRMARIGTAMERELVREAAAR
ncbi:MAG TPA: hypothetical protein VEZ20_15210 [Allosphingosinicella sp.]|nr:hypothetical protein [Allosphingosinicella sp.]